MKIWNNEKGFTLAEAVVAQMILMIVALATLNGFIIGFKFNAESEDKTVATNIAQQKLEEIIKAFITNPNNMGNLHPAGITLFSSLPQITPYYVSINGVWKEALKNGKYQISYPYGLNANPISVKVTVSWDSPTNKEASVSLESLLSK